MAQDRLVKCYGTCKQKYKKSTMFQISNLNYCESCYKAAIKERNDRADLYHYIQETYNVPFPTGAMLRQIKTFKEEKNYTYKNMRLTLKYAFTKKNYKPERKFGLGLIPYFYDEMLDYYRDLQEKRLTNKVEKKETHVVKVKASNIMTDRTVKKKQINMDDLL